MVKSKILGPDGNPIVIKRLTEEIATPTQHGVRRVIEEREASGLTPERLAQLLQNAALGDGRAYLTLAEEMEERYLHYASQLQTRRLAIEGIDPVVDAEDGVDTKIIDAVQKLVEKSSFSDMSGDLGDALGKGFAVSELMWEYEGGVLQPVEYIHRDPRYFQFDRLSLTQLRLSSDTNRYEGEVLEPYKYIRHFPRTKAGIPLRAGLARPAAWAYLIQNLGLKDWASFAEIYGVPFRLGRYGPNASDEDKRSLLRAVRDISSDAAAIAPIGMDIEFHKIEGQHGAAIFGELIDYVDKQVSKLVLGQTMTSDNGGSLAQAKVHNEVRLDLLKADCRQLAQSIQRDLIEPFVAFNFGPQDNYPQIKFPISEPEDTKALTENVARLVPLGFRVSQRDLRERLALPEPGTDDELLVPEQKNQVPAPEPVAPSKTGNAKLSALASHVTGCQCTSCLTKLSAETQTPEADEIDRLIDEELANWEDITEPLLTPLQNILEQASSLEEAKAMLAAAKLDSTPLIDALARSTAKARGLGDVADDLPEAE